MEDIKKIDAQVNVYVDFEELKSMDMSDDVGYAVVETIDSVFKILEKNGICIQK